jgi:hypothetical protein
MRAASAPWRRSTVAPAASVDSISAWSHSRAASTRAAMSLTVVVLVLWMSRMSRTAPAATSAPSARIVVSVLPTWRGASTNVRRCSTSTPNMRHSCARASSKREPNRCGSSTIVALRMTSRWKPVKPPAAASTAATHARRRSRRAKPGGSAAARWCAARPAPSTL